MTTPPTTLADVIRSVVALAMASGDVNAGDGVGVRVFHGEEYLEQNDSPPRIVFVQTAAGGELGAPLAVGARQVASITDTVQVHIWGAGPSDDARLDDARARAMRLINQFKACAPGRLKGKMLDRLQAPKILRFGEQVVLTYSYTWAVPYDQEVWDQAYARAASPAPSPPNPDKPDGDTGAVFSVGSTTLENTRS